MFSLVRRLESEACVCPCGLRTDAGSREREHVGPRVRIAEIGLQSLPERDEHGRFSFVFERTTSACGDTSPVRAHIRRDDEQCVQPITGVTWLQSKYGSLDVQSR